MRRLSLLMIALLACVLVPAGTALAQIPPTTEEPQVVEPEPGEAIPPTTSTPGATTGPDAPVSSGAVTGATGPTGPTGPGSATTGPTGTEEVIATTTGGGDDDDDKWLAIAGIVLAAIILAVLIMWALSRWRGWDPRWRKRWRHANAEAAWRLSAGWAEFRDFLRLGR